MTLEEQINLRIDIEALNPEIADKIITKYIQNAKSIMESILKDNSEVLKKAEPEWQFMGMDKCDLIFYGFCSLLVGVFTFLNILFHN